MRVGDPRFAAIGIWLALTGCGGDAPFEVVDPSAPTIVSTNPAKNAHDVSPQSFISATFSEPMDRATVTGSTVRVSANRVEVLDGSLILLHEPGEPDDTTVYFSTSRTICGLMPNSRYDVTVTTEVHDAEGHPMQREVSWSFWTGPAVPDPTPPSVEAISPLDGATDVPVNSAIGLVFSETMDWDRLFEGFTLRSDNGIVPFGSMTAGRPIGFSSCGKTDMQMDPAEDLQPSTRYTVTVGGHVRDLAGNVLGPDYTWSFTTSADTTTNPVITAVGSVQYISLTAGYGILGDDGRRYLPRGLPADLARDGVRVRFTGTLRNDILFFPMWGTYIELSNAEPE